MKQYATLEATMYFWFAANDTAGSGGDGTIPLVDVRLAGAAVDAIPVLSPTPILLTHANYPAGCYEVAIAATAANGFAINNTYAVFCALTIDSQNPTGFIGSFDLKPVEANAKQLGGTSQTGRDIGANVLLSPGSGAGQLDFTSGVVKSNLAQILGTALTETAGYIAAGFKKLFNVATPLLVASDVMRGTDGANTTVPDVAGTAPTVSEIQTEMEENGASLLDTIRDIVSHGTYGNSALQVLVAALQTDLNNGTDGLGALKALIDILDGVADAIKTKTDNLPADPADDSDIDTQLAAIKAETALIVADTNELQTDDIPGTLATLATAAILKEVNQSLNGAKCVVDRASSSFKVYDTDGTTLLFTITKTTDGNVDTLTRYSS